MAADTKSGPASSNYTMQMPFRPPFFNASAIVSLQLVRCLSPGAHSTSVQPKGGGEELGGHLFIHSFGNILLSPTLSFLLSASDYFKFCISLEYWHHSLHTSIQPPLLLLCFYLWLLYDKSIQVSVQIYCKLQPDSEKMLISNHYCYLNMKCFG